MQKKLIIAVLLNVIIISATLGIVSYYAVHESIQRSLKNRLALARIISNYVEVFLNNNLYRLKDISISGNTHPDSSDVQREKRMLETVYKYSLFTEGVFLLDKHGNELLTYPPQVDYFSNLTYITYVNEVLRTGKPVISNVYTIEPIKKKVIFMMTPLRDGDGRINGIAGGILGPTEHFLNELLQSGKVETKSYIEIIDANETVVAADNPSRVFQHHSHDGTLGRMIMEDKSGILECSHGFSHPDAASRPVDRIAFVPLNVAKWGVIVGETEQDIFGPAISLEKKFFLLVFIFIGISALYSIGASLNMVRPLRSLIASSNSIAAGDLSTPVGDLGSDEILQLSKSFDVMRIKLAESLENVKMQNLELENRVAIRTRQIRESGHKIEHLLKKIITSQEDERRRIARDLHDTILQDTSAFLIKLDICRLQTEKITVEKIDDMRKIALATIDNIHTVIKDLRPAVLDDLGLDSAITWLLATHLQEKGIDYYLDVESSLRKRLPPTVEITLFRILQEAIINTSHHANAENVFVVLNVRETSVYITVEDDGDGFNVDALMGRPIENGRGLGLIGMKERASLLDGRLTVYSKPGEGTKVCMEIPLMDQVHHA
jgi:signal transduction histidine kinase